MSKLSRLIEKQLGGHTHLLDLTARDGKSGSSRKGKELEKVAAKVLLRPNAETNAEADEIDDSVEPEAAYQKLVKALEATNPAKASRAHGTAPKRRKVLSPGSGDQAQGTGEEGQALATSPAAGKPDRKNGKEEDAVSYQVERAEEVSTHEELEQPAIGSSGPSIRTPSKRKGKQRQEYEADAAEPALSMKEHLDRRLTKAEISALENAKLAKDSSTSFAEAWPNAAWLTAGTPLPKVYASLDEFGIRPRLVGLWRDANGITAGDGVDFRDAKQNAFLALCRSYKDVLHTDHAYPSSEQEEDAIVDAALLHCLDHVASTAQRIKKTNETLKADPDTDVPRDQGFTRPKVLILLPMRNIALKVVLRLLALVQKETRKDSVQGKARFLEDFGIDEADGKAEAESKPWETAEHVALFAGNLDDHFRLGIKLTRGAVKLYADFFQSDIIVASPIALATTQAEADANAPEDLDFLSSIEIVLAARCDVLLMQNWAHVTSVFEALNGVPKQTHGVDIMRVYDWYLTGQARYYRQNILLSSFISPALNALFTRHCHSHAGKAKLQPTYKGVLGDINLQQRQMFERVAAKSPVDEVDVRFEHFRTRIWPRIRNSGLGGQMIFVSSYFDYVRLRSFLRAEEVDFEGLSEYASGSEVARGRSRFATGKTRIAVYTERAHFYHRRRTKGVKDLYVYQLPEHGHFYVELVQLLAAAEGLEAGHTTVTVLFSKFDALRLERIVGSSRAQKMLKSATGTFMIT